MRMVRLKRFLTYEYDPRAVVWAGVVAGGGMVWSGLGVVGRGGLVGHTVLRDNCRGFGHRMGMVCMWRVMVILLSGRSGGGHMGLGCRRSRAGCWSRLSH